MQRISFQRSLLFSDDIDDDNANLNQLMKVKAEDLFKRVMSHHSEFIKDCYSGKNCRVNPQHPSLLPKLRPYQVGLSI